MVRNALLILFFMLNLVTLMGQQEVIINIDSQQASKTDIYVNVEQKPEFPGGKAGLIDYYKRTSSFSICEKKEDICQTLYYQIVIDTTGAVENFNIIKGVNSKVDSDAERIVKQMPNWKPGYKEGVPVKVLVTLDIKYKTNE